MMRPVKNAPVHIRALIGPKLEALEEACTAADGKTIHNLHVGIEAVEAFLRDRGR